MRKRFSRLYLLGAFAIAIGGLLAWLRFVNPPSTTAFADSQTSDSSSRATTDSDNQVSPIRIETIKPQPGGIERTTTQPGSVIAFESAQLLAKIPGYLKSQSVDIGDHVQRGQVIAEIDAPEFLKEVDQARAALEQAKAQVAQADARVMTAEADEGAARAAIEQAQAEVERANAARTFREKQYKRIKSLFELKSVDERLVDEKEDEKDAARAAQHLAEAGVTNSKALATAARARVEQAKADAIDAPR